MVSVEVVGLVAEIVLVNVLTEAALLVARNLQIIHVGLVFGAVNTDALPDYLVQNLHLFRDFFLFARRFVSKLAVLLRLEVVSGNQTCKSGLCIFHQFLFIVFFNGLPEVLEEPAKIFEQKLLINVLLGENFLNHGSLWDRIKLN